MPNYRIVFHGRESGALGVLSQWTRTVDAPDDAHAVAALYLTHEHITVLSVSETIGCPRCGQRIDDGKLCGCGARY